VRKSTSFPTNRFPKNVGTIHYISEAGLRSPKRVRRLAQLTSRRIFSLIKSMPAKRKKGFYTSGSLKNQGIRLIVFLAPYNFELLLKFKIKIKISLKHTVYCIVVDDQTKIFLMLPLSDQSYPAEQSL
jgi:hypothetical protein